MIEFLLYLERRTTLHEGSKHSSVDELDCLMWFLSEGLYFAPRTLDGLEEVFLGTRTEDLDLYMNMWGGLRTPPSQVSKRPNPCGS
jgi:hypothetical protein